MSDEEEAGARPEGVHLAGRGDSPLPHGTDDRRRAEYRCGAVLPTIDDDELLTLLALIASGDREPVEEWLRDHPNSTVIIDWG